MGNPGGAGREPGRGRVLVIIESWGVCGADVWMIEGELSYGDFPLALGHEGVGEVGAVGEGVTSRKIGGSTGVCTLQTTRGHCEYWVMAYHANEGIFFCEYETDAKIPGQFGIRNLLDM